MKCQFASEVRIRRLLVGSAGAARSPLAVEPWKAVLVKEGYGRLDLLSKKWLSSSLSSSMSRNRFDCVRTLPAFAAASSSACLLISA
jgi:hypothetical protein